MTNQGSTHFDTKIAILIEKGLQSWQELNVAAFLASAIAHRFPETLGPEFIDRSRVHYLAIFRQPVVLFQGSQPKLKKAYHKARAADLAVGIYTRPIFQTQGEANVRAVAAVAEVDQDLVGLVLYGPAELVTQATKHVSLHP